MPLIEKRVLWVDDEGARRFPYESLVLMRAGWTVSWAEDAQEAARALEATSFDALVLDQMLPYNRETAQGQSAAGVWGGCLLLYWLRGRRLPSHAPVATDFARLYEIEALERNRKIPVVVVSGFYDNEVVGTMREASVFDDDLQIVPKPVDSDELLSILEGEATHPAT